MVFTFVVTQVVDSVKIVSINKNEEPPSVSTIDYITKIMIENDTKFYCLNDWRLFQYYARNGVIRRIAMFTLPQR